MIELVFLAKNVMGAGKKALILSVGGVNPK